MSLNTMISHTSSGEPGMRGVLHEQQHAPPPRTRSGEHLLKMLDTMLILSAIDDGAMVVDIEALDIADLIEDVLDCSTELTSGKPIDLRWEVEPGLPPAAANHTHVKEILCHLLTNAAKFTDSGTIFVRAVRDGARIVLSVADSGIGIADEHHMAIFEDFYQVKGTGGRQGIGVGLGLGICRRLVELYGGRIWVESAPGAGATFVFSLPTLAAEAQPGRAGRDAV